MKMSRLSVNVLVALSLAVAHHSARAEVPFAQCPTQAFLIQNPNGFPVAYGVDIDLGSYRALESNMGSAKLNGAGYSKHDDFIYAWDYDAKTLAKLDAEFVKYPLEMTQPAGVPERIYVGDVAVHTNAWFGYHPSYGLIKADLETLVMTQVANPSDFGTPAIYDLAFHPDNGLAYSIDANGYLIEIDVEAGSSTRLNQVLNKDLLGYKLTFGAIYFDVDGNLYGSNNANGLVFRVTLDGTQSSADFFAYGPSSNSNDGARCALAPVVASDNTDFGDAPDSYQTSYAALGARHGISGLTLGLSVDGESEAYLPPLSDDSADGLNDDDGVAFPVPLQVGQTSMVQVTVTGASADSVLNGWIDWDRDGQFDSSEQIITDRSVIDGTASVFFDAPTWAQSGETWARFRLSNTSGIGPSGGVPEGEVEDYRVDITESGVTTESYPAGGEYTTFAYEDQYPMQGDYDMNDVLMNVRYTEYQLDGQVIRLKMEGQVAALGGDYHSGFAIRLPGIAQSDIKQDSVRLTVNGEEQNRVVLEPDTIDAVFIIEEDLWDITEPGEAANCSMFRTQEQCGTSYRPTWTLHVTLLNAPSLAQMPDFPYDPFIFAAPGHYHGDIGHQLSGSHPGRSLEIHLKNHAPTVKFDPRYRANGVDASSGDTYYHTSNGLPWAIEIPTNWAHPLEQVDILNAYPSFDEFAQDDNGTTATNWYTLAVPSRIYID